MNNFSRGLALVNCYMSLAIL